MSSEYQYTPARRGARQSSTGWIKGVVALAVLGAAAAGFFLWPRDLAAALEKGMAAQKAAKTLVAKGKVTLNMDIGMGEQKMEMPLALAVEQPNKLSMAMGDSKSPFTVKMVCDGKTMYMDMPMLGKVIAMPAPKTLEEMSKSQMSTGMMGGMGGGKGLMPGQLTKDDIAKVVNGLPKDDPWFKTLTAPDGTRAATVETKEGLKLAVWLDPSTGIVYQVAANMNEASMQKAAAKQDPKAAAALPQGMKMNMKLLVTFDQFDLDAKTTADQFKYNTSGKKVVKVKSMDDLKNPAVLLGN